MSEYLNRLLGGDRAFVLKVSWVDIRCVTQTFSLIAADGVGIAVEIEGMILLHPWRDIGVVEVCFLD